MKTAPEFLHVLLSSATRLLSEGNVAGAQSLVEDAQRLSALVGMDDARACGELVHELVDAFACARAQLDGEFARDRAHAPRRRTP